MKKPTPRAVHLKDIQGNVLLPYALDYASHLFVHIDDELAGRAWLESLGDDVTDATPWPSKGAGIQVPESTLNLAFTCEGLRALGVPPEVLCGFSEEFQEGMAASANELGDTPGEWEDPWRGRQVHAMVAVHGDTKARVDASIARVSASLPTGIRPLGEPQEAQRLYRSPQTVIEHFGFADGFGQPALDIPTSIPDLPVKVFRGQGTYDPKMGWKPVALGEFLLGHYDEEGVLPEAPDPPALADNGTYLVYRKLRQDVIKFRTYIEQQANRLGWTSEKVGAAIVGRWPDGSPLELTPDRPDPALADERHNNDFRYGADSNGHGCPLGAHIRRANPRDGLPLSQQLTSRHRMLRRGITYGAPLPAGAPDDGADRGLLFMALVASPRRQFDFVQGQWLNDGNTFHLGDDRDALAGATDGCGKMTIQGRPPRFLAAVPQFVTMRGGEYFFKPSIPALRWLAASH